MLRVDEALEHVRAHAQPKPARVLPLGDVLGMVLAEEVASDVDSPPHDKAMVDGYAVRAEDLASGQAELEILEEVVAGATPTKQVARGQSTRIMTGAPLPAGADAVVMIEFTQAVDAPSGPERSVNVRGVKVRAGDHIMPRATVTRRGDVVLPAGVEIRPVEIGLLAEIGRARVKVIDRPTVSILPTGDELVPPGEPLRPGQIRNSNGPMLTAAARRAGAVVRALAIGRDNSDSLRELITEGLQDDVLVLSGGVSAGVLDLAPSVLAELGVRQVFHKVKLKPGKPIWFGVFSAETGEKLVFGLPGNPVSSLVCFELFVRPAIDRLAGRSDVSDIGRRAVLIKPHVHRGDRPTYWPAIVRGGKTHDTAEPVAWHGSADLRGFATANALICFPEGDRSFCVGDEVEVIRFA